MEKHGLVRGLIVPEVVKMISEKYSCDEDKALDMFYTSVTGQAFADNESGLYGQSPLYISSLFDEEMKRKGK